MKNLLKHLFVATALLTVPGIASAEQPTQAEVAASKATYTGTLQGAKNDAGKADWACTATVKGDGVVEVKWSDSTATYKGKLGPAGGKAGNPIVMNAKGSDNSEVRFEWVSPTELQVEWWPNMAAKAGQQQNQPAHRKGKLKKQ